MTDFEKRLLPPTGPIDVILDTDAFNEIDDQFALSYMLSYRERLNVKALYAAPFFNQHSTGPEDGMIKSYNEILTLLDFAGRSDLKEVTFKGSIDYLKDEKTPQISDAAKDLSARAMKYSSENPLYVVAIGAITNVASAILLNPEIADKIVIVWLGGHAQEWPDTMEFNMKQDVAAARVIFGCASPVVQLPCFGIVDHFYISEPELNYWFMGKNPLATYLAQATINEANAYAKGKPWTRVIWDVTAVAYLVNDNNRFMDYKIIPSPICQYDHHYSFDVRRHPISYVTNIKRDSLMNDLISRLTK
ncbi:MAG: nucleoside hydrolase [Clostridia bacterium]|nr:nucleoside hydrolase [Clostridia bacterium]